MTAHRIIRKAWLVDPGIAMQVAHSPGCPRRAMSSGCPSWKPTAVVTSGTWSAFIATAGASWLSGSAN